MYKSEYQESKQNGSIMLFVCFSIWSFIVLCRPQDYLVFLGHLRPALTFGVLLLLMWGLSTNRTVKFAVDNQLVLYKYLIIVFLISIPFSSYRSGSLIDLLQYCSVILFVFMSYRCVNSISRMRVLLFTYCMGIGIYTIYIFINGRFMDGRISFANMFDPNDIAFVILSFIVFNLLFITKNNSGYERVLCFVNIVIGLIILMKTGSRSGFIALVAVVTYLLFSRSNILKVSFIKKMLIMAMAILSLYFVDMSSERYKSILDLQNDYNRTGEEGRIAIWKMGINMMFAHPFTGVGFNRFPEGVGRAREARGLDSTKWQTAHNSLIQIGAETGIFGAVLFFVMSLNAFKIFTQVSKKSENAELARIGEIAKAGFIGLFICAMFLSQAYSVYWALYLVLSAILRRMYENEKQQKMIA